MPGAEPAGLARSVADRLAAAGCVAAEQEAQELLGAAPDRRTVDDWVRRREQGEPLAWITTSVVFCGRRLHIDAGVYVPRRQTEDLARRAAAVLPAGGRALDLCTGNGAVAAHLATVPSAAVIGVDVDRRAARCARRNGVAAVVADLDGGLRSGGRPFDVVTAVAPYVPTGDLRLLPRDVQRYEPRHALDGGDDGLAVVLRVAAAAYRLLHPGGWLFVEVGGHQDEILGQSLVSDGFGVISPWWDDDGDLRGVAAQRAGAG